MSYDFDTATLATKPKSDIVREMMAALSNLDALAREMERKWGASRLPALVPDELAQRFYRQLEKLNAASRAHQDEETTVQAKRMESAWRYLDHEAERLGAEPIKPCVWETRLSNGSVVAIVRDEDEALAVDPVDRSVQVYTLAEIGRLIEGFPDIAKIKDTFPGAKVSAVRCPPPDGFWERGDELPF